MSLSGSISAPATAKNPYKMGTSYGTLQGAPFFRRISSQISL